MGSGFAYCGYCVMAGENQQWDDLDGWMIRMGVGLGNRGQEREKAIGVGALWGWGTGIIKWLVRKICG